MLPWASSPVPSAPTAPCSGSTSLPAGSTLDLRSDGTFTYVPPAAGACTASFTYLVNGMQSHTATITDCARAVSCAGSPPVAGSGSFTSNVATLFERFPRQACCSS